MWLPDSAISDDLYNDPRMALQGRLDHVVRCRLSVMFAAVIQYYTVAESSYLL